MSNIAVIVVALAMVLYHLISSQELVQSSIGHLNTHLAFCLALVFLAGLAEGEGKSWRLWSLVFLSLSLLATGYVQVLYPELLMRPYFNTPTDLVIGVLLIFLTLEATRRSFGLMLPILVLIVVLYPFIGLYLPEPFYCSSWGLVRTISNLSVALRNGIYGVVLPTSANYIFLFIVFGGLLQALGGTAFFLSLGKLAVGKFRGGAGLMSVITSAALGSITGSAAANITITGSFTIPLMKKVGYRPEHAAGIEAAASNGGAIMPPIMGVCAFAMAGLTGIPYMHIIAMAAIPAILYFFSAGVYVYLRAGQLKIAKVAEEKVDIRELLLSSPIFLVPFATIITTLMMGYSVMYAAFWTIISLVTVVLIRKRTRPSLGAFIDGFTKGAKLGAGIGVTCAAIGMLMASFTMSGLGVKLAHGIEGWSQGYLFLGLLIVWATCVLLGFGGPSLVAYIIVSIFAVPALIKMGVGFEQAHFFTMYSAIFAFVTPPVAIAALIAARLAAASYMKSAIEAVKVAAAAFLLPFMFIYCPILLLQPRELLFDITGIIAIIVSIVALQVGLVGYAIGKCNSLQRILATTGAASLIAFLPLHNYMLFAVGMALFGVLTFWQLKEKKARSETKQGVGK